MNYLIIALAVINITSLILVILFCRRLLQSVGGLLLFFVSEQDGMASPFEEQLKSVGSSIGDSLKGKFAGSLGQIKRQENALIQDAVSDEINAENPILGMIVDQLSPSVKKRVLQNPMAAVALANLSRRFGAGGNGLNNRAGGGSSLGVLGVE